MGRVRFPVTWGALFNPAPSSTSRPRRTERALNVSLSTLLTLATHPSPCFLCS